MFLSFALLLSFCQGVVFSAPTTKPAAPPPERRTNVYGIDVPKDVVLGMSTEQVIIGGVLAVFDIITDEQRWGRYNDFTFSRITVAFDNEGGTMVVLLTGEDLFSPVPGIMLTDEKEKALRWIKTNLDGLEKYLAQTVGKENVSKMAIYKVIVERGGNVHFLFYDTNEQAEPSPEVTPIQPEPPPKPEQGNPPSINPSPSNRPDHAARPPGAPFPFKLFMFFILP
jgi:hypothetical protein